jgi:hypothetical protein
MMAPYNRGGWTEPAEQYRRILDGNLTGYTVSMNEHVLGCMALEAYRCWIEDDRDAGLELCKAIENIADRPEGLKWLLPEDPAVDYVWRVYMGDNDVRQRRYTPIGRLEHYMANIRYPKTYGKRLVVPSYSVTPEYKIMLYPYRFMVANRDRLLMGIIFMELACRL